MATAEGHTSAIRSSKVVGTPVFNPTGERIGKIEDVVLDKLSNNIMFAVVGFGGILGMNEKFHPLPWSSLNYSDAENGYVVSYSKDQLKSAPADTIDELTRNDGLGYRDQAYAYYNAPPYWI